MKSAILAILLAITACGVKHHEDKKIEEAKMVAFEQKLIAALTKAVKN